MRILRRGYAEGKPILKVNRTTEERFYDFVPHRPLRRNGGCWLFTGAINKVTGYGVFSYAGGHTVNAHTYAFRLWKGDVPSGLHIDHVRARGCIHRHCVRPYHLEAVSQATNNRRAAGLA
jgi:hypothetical protein